MSVCESLSELQVPATARALLHLALRGRAAASQPAVPRAAGAPPPPPGGEGQWGDLDLLHAVAADVRGMLESGE